MKKEVSTKKLSTKKLLFAAVIRFGGAITYELIFYLFLKWVR